VNTLVQRLARVEDAKTARRAVTKQAVAASPPVPAGGLDLLAAPQPFPDDEEEEKQRVYAAYFADRGPILNIGCGRGDFLKVLLSEGFQVEGIDADRGRVDELQDRELPVRCEEAIDYLSHVGDGLLGGVFLNHVFDGLAPRQISNLLALCWLKLKKGGVLIVETDNPACVAGSAVESTFSVDLLSYLLESQCFALVDQVFSRPIHAELPGLVQSSTGDTYDMKQFRNYALVGRK
jgi:Methyltransferase domain